MYGYIKTKTFMKILLSLWGKKNLLEPAVVIIRLSNFVLFIT